MAPFLCLLLNLYKLSNLHKRLKRKTFYLFYIISIPKHKNFLDKIEINLKD